MSEGFTPGDRLGRYELVNVVGGGGFASVWRARTVGPGGFARDVAIKVIRPARASQKRFQDMLLDEARLVALIQHPNVTQIWEVGEDPRSLYIVMELVEGKSLDDLRFAAEEAGKTLSLRAIFRVLADVCAGLHVAHELAQDGRPLGLVHRDVSPQNILVSRHGTAKLIDFGIAKAKERLIADTTTGFIKGKISFMAPEQARTEEDIDRRADVWAIGAVAYELIEGKPPCDGYTDLGRLAALVAPTPVPPMSDAVPEPLRRVVARTLEKEKTARYASALELKEAIEEALIESELETSDADVATLFRPYFDPRPQSSPAISADDGDSVERAVSSTIDVRRSPAESTEVVDLVRPKQKDAPIDLPLHRRRVWPIALAAIVAVAILGAWQLTPKSTPADPRAAATSSDDLASTSDVGGTTGLAPSAAPTTPSPTSTVTVTPQATSDASPSVRATSPTARPASKVQGSGSPKGSASSRKTAPPPPSATVPFNDNDIE